MLLSNRRFSIPKFTSFTRTCEYDFKTQYEEDMGIDRYEFLEGFFLAQFGDLKVSVEGNNGA